jgi:hypothetical protein
MTVIWVVMLPSVVAQGAGLIAFAVTGSKAIAIAAAAICGVGTLILAVRKNMP